MAFIYTLTNAAVTNTDPAGTDLISLGDDNIRNFKSAVIERVNSRFVDVNADPWIMKSPVSGGNVQSIVPNSDNLYTLGTAALRFAQIWGTISTASQPSITSLGTLTSLNSSGHISIENGVAFRARRNTGGAYVDVFRYDTGTDDLSTVLGGTMWRIRDTGAGTLMSLNAAGSPILTVAHVAAIIDTAAQPNITSLGTQIATIGNTAALILDGSGRGLAYQYLRMINTGGQIFMGVESSTGGGLIASGSAYAGLISTVGANPLQLGTNSVVRQTIDSAGNVVFTGTVTAANFVGPTSIDANALTGTTLAAGVVNSSLKNFGTVTSMSMSNTGIVPLAINRTEAATSYLGHLRIQRAGTTLGFLGTDSADSIGFINAAASAMTFSWTNAGVFTFLSTVNAPSFVGNLTGTVQTAAQGNITSLGTLTSLNVTGDIHTFAGVSVERAGSDTVGAGPYIQVYNPTATRVWLTQMSAAFHYDIWRFNGGAWNTVARFTLTDQFLVGTTSVVGIAAGGIHVAGTSIFQGGLTVSSTNTGDLRTRNNGIMTASGGDYPYTGYNFTGTAVSGVYNYIGADFASSIQFVAGGISFRTAPSGVAGNPITWTERMLIAQGGAVTANGAWTFNSTIAGVTTLTATSIFGTLATAAQTNITSLGTLTSLGIASNSSSDIIVGGSPTRGLQVQFGQGSVNVGVGSIFSGGYGFISHNALQTAKDTDNWAQQLGTIASSMIEVGPNAISFYNAIVGKAAGTKVVFWGTPKIDMNTANGTLTAVAFVGDLTGNHTGTVLTAAQGNITSLGTLTALSISGNLTFTAAAARIIPGATSLTFRNNANTADIMSLANGGTVSFAGTGGATATIDLLGAGKLFVNGVQVVTVRATGWATATATQSRTAITNADTLAQTISHLAALKEDLTGHGLIGA